MAFTNRSVCEPAVQDRFGIASAHADAVPFWYVIGCEDECVARDQQESGGEDAAGREHIDRTCEKSDSSLVYMNVNIAGNVFGER